MLLTLQIGNILLIKDETIEFAEGLSVLTGETGAGKSIVLNAILFVLGKKTKTATQNLLRSGENQGIVVGVFDISKNILLANLLSGDGFADLGIDVTQDLILKRVLLEGGKNRCYVNDKIVSVSLLEQIGDCLVEVHRQNEQKGLLLKQNHVRILDEYCGAKNLSLEVAGLYSKVIRHQRELEEQIKAVEHYKNQQDYLSNVVKELSALNVQKGEELSLIEERRNLMQNEKLFGVLNGIKTKLFGQNSVNGLMAICSKGLVQFNGNEEVEKIEGSIDRIYNELEDLESLLEESLGKSEFDPIRLDDIEQRLFSIKEVTRKYSTTCDDIPELLAKNMNMLEQINSAETLIAGLNRQIAHARVEYFKKAEDLSNIRQAGTTKLEEFINSELKDLKFDGAEFKVEVIKTAGQLSTNGINEVCFIARTNIGTPFGDIAKIASGGELSRFMLAVKSAFLTQDGVPTIIFDEIDAGIGGATSEAVGKKLQDLALKNQVILVTHQAQIASKARLHFKISKSSADGNTVTRVVKLGKDERVREISRMLSGDEAVESLQNATRMLS